MSEPLNIGPWPLGVNNVDSQRARAFQPAMQPGDKPPMLREADNLDLDRNGFLKSRVGRTKALTLTSAHSAVSVGGHLLLVDDGALKLVIPGGTYQTETLATGLGPAEVSYAALGGDVFWSSENANGRITNGQAAFWGLDACAPPSLSPSASGALRAGRYLVAVTVEANGIESGCRGSSLVTLTETGGISVSIVGIDSNATSMNVYVSDTDGKDLFWVRNQPIVQNFTVDQVGISLDLLDGLGVYPPPKGQIVREFKGRLLVAAGSTLYWSGALEPHRFRLGSDLQMFQSRIVLLEPTIDGFYVACEAGPTWFVQGDDPDNWRPMEVATIPVCEGSALRIEGSKLPWAQTDALCVVWATRDGWAAGQPGGIIKYPTSGRIAMDTNAKASLVFREEGGLRQILLAARDKTALGRFGATDRATATVIKADGTIQ
jgi:hypothetical protein